MKPELKKLLLLNLPYLLFVYLFAKCGQAYRLAAGADASAKLLHLTSGIFAAFANPLPSLHPFDLCVGVVGAVAVRLIVYNKGKNAKKYRKGEEYGSARWGTAKDIAPYIDPKFENNILLTQTERLTMTGRPKDPKTARNKNVLVIGGSGSGKTRFYVKPNLMQCFPTSDYPTSFVVTDPKGTLVLETGQMFQRAGYRVKILNTINFSKSMKYNPFVYIHSEKDVLKLVNTLIANTKGEGEKSAEDFWVKSERLFYTALIGYIWYEAPAEEMNFTTLLEMINASEAREDDPEFQSPVDLMFERLEQKDPDHFAVRQYKKFLLSAGKTRSSILISCGARLAPFDIREVRELMEDDEMELDTIGDEKTVLFLIMSDTDTTFNFILAIKMLREAARSDQPEDKLLLWLSRPSGTFCFRERDVLLKDTQAYNTWKFCGEQTHDRILAYAVELTGAANGTVQGNLYELDYQQHFQHIREAALPVGANRLIYESGMREIGPKEHFDSRPDKYFGEFVRYEMQPRDPKLLQAAIRQEQRSREPARPGDFKEHLAELHTGLIEAEAQRIATDMKRLAAPNSPDKNHFMVEVSPYFTKLASSRDTDQLLAMLPYKSLHLSSVKDRFGIYALVDKNENRGKNIRKPRASVRKQLSETKQAASPKKAAARSKQHEMEV